MKVRQSRMKHIIQLFGLAIVALGPWSLGAEAGKTLRFYQGVTAYVNNPDGAAFDVSLDLRDWNLMENGPRPGESQGGELIR